MTKKEFIDIMSVFIHKYYHSEEIPPPHYNILTQLCDRLRRNYSAKLDFIELVCHYRRVCVEEKDTEIEIDITSEINKIIACLISTGDFDELETAIIDKFVFYRDNNLTNYNYIRDHSLLKSQPITHYLKFMDYFNEEVNKSNDNMKRYFEIFNPWNIVETIGNFAIVQKKN